MAKYRLSLVPVEWRDESFQNFVKKGIKNPDWGNFNSDANILLNFMRDYNSLDYNYYNFDFKDSIRCKLEPKETHSVRVRWINQAVNNEEVLLRGKIVFPNSLDELKELLGSRDLTKKKVEIDHPDGIIRGNLVKEKGDWNINYYLERNN